MTTIRDNIPIGPIVSITAWRTAAQSLEPQHYARRNKRVVLALTKRPNVQRRKVGIEIPHFTPYAQNRTHFNVQAKAESENGLGLSGTVRIVLIVNGRIAFAEVRQPASNHREW